MALCIERVLGWSITAALWASLHLSLGSRVAHRTVAPCALVMGRRFVYICVAYSHHILYIACCMAVHVEIWHISITDLPEILAILQLQEDGLAALNRGHTS